MENKNFFNLQTTVLAFINSGKEGNLAPKEINNTLCFKVAANSGPRDENGKFKYPAKWVQIYVRNENLKAIVKGACDSGKLVKFEGSISSQAYIDKEGKPQSQLVLNAYDINVLSSRVKEEDVIDTDFNPEDYSSENEGFTAPQL